MTHVPAEALTADAPSHLTLVTEQDIAPHGDLECADVEALMAEATESANQSRARADFLATQLAAAEAEANHLRTERARLIALVNAIQSKHTLIADDRDSLVEQVDLLTDEITAMDQALIPEGSVLFAALTNDEVRSTYREVSRVSRGPLPPAIHDAVRAERALVEDAMRTAGQEALRSVIRRAVRRRRDQARRSTRRSTRA